MLFSNLYLSVVALCALVAQSSAASLTFAQQLSLARNHVQKIGLIAGEGGNESFVFDFNKPPKAGITDQQNSSRVIAANVVSYPMLTGIEGAMTIYTLGPCGMIMPHVHPRADEFMLVTEGQFYTQFLTEGGSQVISNNLTKYQATMFPVGSIHYEINPTCETSVFVGNFNSNDPGTLIVTNAIFSLDELTILNQLGGVVSGEDIDSIREALPSGPIYSVESCLERCGIAKNQKRSVSEIIDEMKR